MADPMTTHTLTEALERFTLISGKGSPEKNQACAMTMLAWIHGDEWSDRPECASRLLARNVIIANDSPQTTPEMRAELVKAGMEGVLDTGNVPDAVIAWALSLEHGEPVPTQYDRTLEAIRRIAWWKAIGRPPANLIDAKLTNADLTDADLICADLTGACLRGANLGGAYLRYSDLTAANLAVANLTDAYLTGAELYGANLGGAYLRYSDLTAANLAVANLTDANLTGAELYGANLGGAYLRGANLTDANLRYADLTNAILTEADLRGANLTDAILTDADLTVAKGLMSREMTCSNCGREYDTRDYRLPLLCPDCKIAALAALAPDTEEEGTDG
jgi:hypothetical protein